MHLYNLFRSQIVLILIGSAIAKPTPSKANAYRHVHRQPATVPLESSFPDPNVDPFYEAPATIATFAPGQVIRSRKVLTTVTGHAVQSYQVFYRTTDNQNNAIGSVATIWVPDLPLDPPRMLAFPQAEDAVNLDCAPSWAWVNESSTQEVAFQLTSFVIPWAISQGYYVVVSDAEGPDSAWLVGLTEGRATLDGTRTAINFLNLPTPQTQVAILGYSGGGHTSVWASSLAEAYAPELNIVGAAFGGTPVDLRPAYDQLNGGPAALLAGGALIGLANGYPGLNRTFNSLYTSNGAATVSKLRGPNQCIAATVSGYAGFNFSTLFTSDIFQNPVLLDVLARESLLTNVSNVAVPVPKFPRYQWHGMSDDIVPFGPEAAYVQQQCAKGANIAFLSLAGLDHGTALIVGLPGALLFIHQAFDGTLEQVGCEGNVTALAIGSAAAEQLLGANVNMLLEAEFQAQSS